MRLAINRRRRACDACATHDGHRHSNGGIAFHRYGKRLWVRMDHSTQVPVRNIRAVLSNTPVAVRNIPAEPSNNQARQYSG